MDPNNGAEDFSQNKKNCSNEGFSKLISGKEDTLGLFLFNLFRVKLFVHAVLSV